MCPARLSLAIDSGSAAIPASGRVVVLRPPIDRDITALPVDRVQVVHGFRPDHDAWQARGYCVGVAAAGPFGAAIAYPPRARSAARALVAEAVDLAAGGPVIVDGQKTDGIDSLLRACRDRAEVTPPLAKAHGKLFTLHAEPDAFADWRAPGPHVLAGGLRTAPGIFAAEGPDAGSVLLAQALPAKLPARVADLGAGWGYLSAAILARDGVAELDVVEAERAALDCARANLDDARVRLHWADARGFAPDRPRDAVVTNPPFHTGRAADPALGAAFIAAAARMLTTSGTLWLVANRHLPYERPLTQAFRETEEAGGDSAFKILRARRPRAKG